MILGLLLLYFIGKRFATLAEDHQKNKWLFAILGALSYYVGSFIGGIFIALIFMASGSLDDLNGLGEIQYTIISLVFGIGTTVGFYQLLKYLWGKNQTRSTDVTLLDEV
ncbi:hypothetical protein SAMN05216474_2836 [Lishizhenia tianjinensis]|uniref:Uncharacterized protein n=1 Tax=Lishizhenia tianjinensis TaxID=477690 RepID=A0A1I7BKA2_9FLAO|nr:hypothetical protein [Lishizhenia tianjinensis]SFT87608.1 hypothetical protein SAMN05216474_2836 [Lishizhenia tianjinensis]